MEKKNIMRAHFKSSFQKPGGQIGYFFTQSTKKKPLSLLSISCPFFQQKKFLQKSSFFTIPGLCRSRFFGNKDLLDSSSVQKSRRNSRVLELLTTLDGVKPHQLFLTAEVELKVLLVFLMTWKALP